MTKFELEQEFKLILNKIKYELNDWPFFYEHTKPYPSHYLFLKNFKMYREFVGGIWQRFKVAEFSRSGWMRMRRPLEIAIATEVWQDMPKSKHVKLDIGEDGKVNGVGNEEKKI